jgi:hypothetical protein
MRMRREPLSYVNSRFKGTAVGNRFPLGSPGRSLGESFTGFWCFMVVVTSTQFAKNGQRNKKLPMRGRLRGAYNSLCSPTLAMFLFALAASVG